MKLIEIENRRYYEGVVTELTDNQIFVFGSNTQGRHGKGAALTAKEKFGAVYGQASGLQGKSYAIVTKDLTKKVHPSIPLTFIIEQIKDLYIFALCTTDTDYLISYTNTPTLNQYPIEFIAMSFARAAQFNDYEIPSNIIFNKEFGDIVLEGLKGFKDNVSDYTITKTEAK